MLSVALIVASWACLIFIIFVTLSPSALRPKIAGAPYERVAAFAMLGLLFGLAYPQYLVWVLVAAAIGAAVLEALQGLIPSRHARVADALQKAAGAAVGVALAYLVVSFVPLWFSVK